MKPARIVFPGFWFGQSDLAQAEVLARRGVGGFCVYGATAQQALDFTRRMNEASPYGKLLFCADFQEDLSEVITDAPSLPPNRKLVKMSRSQDAAYRKGNLLGRIARAAGLDWLLAPVVDLGDASPAFSPVPLTVTRLAGDMLAGISNAGALNCIKYFPGGSGVLKILPQMEDAEFVPYKHLFRRADAVMPANMVFPNIDNDRVASLSDKVVKDLLKKRLNYKGCVVGFPLFHGKPKQEVNNAVAMLRAGVENIMAPRNAEAVIDAIEREVDRGDLMDQIIHAVSNHEMLLSKVNAGPEPDEIADAFKIARQFFRSAEFH